MESECEFQGTEFAENPTSWPRSCPNYWPNYWPRKFKAEAEVEVGQKFRLEAITQGSEIGKFPQKEEFKDFKEIRPQTAGILIF